MSKNKDKDKDEIFVGSECINDGTLEERRLKVKLSALEFILESEKTLTRIERKELEKEIKDLNWKLSDCERAIADYKKRRDELEESCNFFCNQSENRLCIITAMTLALVIAIVIGIIFIK
jgi:chromosome segregation ATPase